MGGVERMSLDSGCWEDSRVWRFTLKQKLPGSYRNAGKLPYRPVHYVIIQHRAASVKLSKLGAKPLPASVDEI